MRILQILLLALTALLLAKPSMAFDVPLGLDGRVLTENGSSLEGVEIVLINARTAHQIIVRAENGVYRTALVGQPGDTFEITASAGSLHAERSVDVTGVLHNVDLILSERPQSIMYEDPTITGVPLPFRFFGSIRAPLFSRPRIQLTNHRTNLSVQVTPYQGSPDYLVVMPGLPGDTVVIEIDGVRIGTVMLDREWLEVSIDAGEKSFELGSRVFPERPRRDSRIFLLLIFGLVLVLLLLLLARHTRKVRR